MKVGDKVSVTDCSYVTKFKNGTIEECYEILTGEKWKVIAINCLFPVCKVGMKRMWINDTVISRVNGGSIRLINSKFLSKEKKTYVKKASEIVLWLENNGYETGSNGSWTCSGKLAFMSGMFYYVGHEIHDNRIINGLVFLPEWIEER